MKEDSISTQAQKIRQIINNSKNKDDWDKLLEEVNKKMPDIEMPKNIEIADSLSSLDEEEQKKIKDYAEQVFEEANKFLQPKPSNIEMPKNIDSSYPFVKSKAPYKLDMTSMSERIEKLGLSEELENLKNSEKIKRSGSMKNRKP